MDRLTVRQLGNVVAGELTKKNSEEENTSWKVFGGDLEETNIPVPIVLWNKKSNTAARVFYYHKEIRRTNNAFKGSIEVLFTPGQGLGSRIKSMFDGYPVTVSGKDIFTEDDERTIAYFDDFYTLDVNGDGIQELIITRHTGDIDVYGMDKRITTYAPRLNPALFEYSMASTCSATLEDHDELWLVRTRQAYSEDKLSDAELREYKNSRDYTLVRVSPEGIKAIHPKFKGSEEPDSILDVAVINRPGSKTVDEIILVSAFSGKKGYYMSRHTPSGAPLDEPREIHAETYDPSMTTLFFIPQSNQIMAFSLQRLKLFYFTPEKPVNWIKTVYLEDITGGEISALFLDYTTIDGMPVTLVEHKDSIYAIDANGKYRTSMTPGGEKSVKPVALGKIKPFSNEHNIIEMFPIGPDMDRILVIESRDPKRREHSLEELEKAGEKFLSYDELAFCKSHLNIEFDEDIKNRRVPFYCSMNKISIPEVASITDIKNKLPGFYNQLIKESKSSYYTSLEVTLFSPIDNENIQMIKEYDYRSKEEYIRWLNNAFITPELVLSIHRMSDGTVTREKIDSYHYKNLDDAETINLPTIKVKTSGEHGQAFLVLHRKYLNLVFDPTFYTVTW